MNAYISVVFFFFSILGQAAIGQDTLTMLDGKTLIGKVIDADSSFISFQFNKKKKVKERLISTEIIFSISYPNDKLDTIYVQNPQVENYLTVKEMHYFIMGEQDAKAHYKATLTSILGVAFGGVLGYVMPEGIWVAAVPLAYTVGASLSPVKIIYEDNRTIEIMSSPAYQEGYIKVARSKKAFNAIASSLAGTLIGVGARYVTN